MKNEIAVKGVISFSAAIHVLCVFSLREKVDNRNAIYKEALYCLGASPRRNGLVVSVSASRAVGRGFAPRPGHTKDHHNNGTYWPPALIERMY